MSAIINFWISYLIMQFLINSAISANFFILLLASVVFISFSLVYYSFWIIYIYFTLVCY